MGVAVGAAGALFIPGRPCGSGVAVGWLAPLSCAVGGVPPSYWMTWISPPGSTPSFSVWCRLLRMGTRTKSHSA